jgi:hypothetical protein
MKNTIAGLIIGVVGSVVAGAAVADTTQRAVLGESGNPAYPVQVEGGDNVIYNCRENLIQLADGRSARECVRVREGGGTLFEAGDGIGNAAPAIGIVVVAAAFASGGSDSTATTTTTAGQ